MNLYLLALTIFPSLLILWIFVKSDKFGIIMKLSLLLCLVGIHQYKIIDVTYGFGASDSIITLECKICGIKKIEKN